MNLADDLLDRPWRAVVDLYFTSGFDGMTEGQRKFFLVLNLLGEVSNGALDQYFFNSTGHLALPTADVLDELGFDRPATAVRAASSRFPGGVPHADWDERRAWMDGIGDEELQEWEALSSAILEEEPAIKAALLRIAESF